MQLYDLILTGVGTRRLRAVKLLAAAGFRHRQAEQLADRLPEPVLRAAPEPEARALQQALERAGGAAHLVLAGERHLLAETRHPRLVARLLREGTTVHLALLQGSGTCRTTRSAHRTEDEARTHYRALLGQLCREGGYRPCDAAHEALAPHQRDGWQPPWPETDEARQVYQDWLLDRGDVRGELIALQAARRRARGKQAERLASEEARLLSRWGELLLGELARYPRQLELGWHLGFVERLALRHGDHLGLADEPALQPRDLPGICRLLRELGVTRGLRELSGAVHPHHLVEALLAEGPPSTVIVLRLGPADWLGEVGALVARLPRLEQLELTGLCRLDGLQATALRELALWGGATHPRVLEAVTNTALPALRALRLGCRAPRWPVELRPLLTRHGPRLEQLELCGEALHVPLATWLGRQVCRLPRLRCLTVDGSSLDERSARALAPFGPRLQRRDPIAAGRPLGPAWIAPHRLRQLLRLIEQPVEEQPAAQATSG